MEIKIDLKDKKILFELDKNSRASLTEIAKKVKLSKEVVFHRINKLVREKVILKFHTVPASYRFGISAYKVYLRLSDLPQKEYDLLIAYLLNNKDVFWVGVCKGRWDLIFGIWAKSTEEFFIIHDKIMDKFSKYVQEKELSISRENIQYSRRWFYDDSKPPVEFNFGEKEEKIILNQTDQKILDALVDNSRIKVTDLAKQLKLNANVVSYGIRSLEKQNIIKGYKCLFNPSALGFCTCKAFVFFKNINEERKKEFVNYFKMLGGSVNVVITFAPWDLELEIEAKTYEEYFKIMDDIKEKFSDVVKFYDSVLISAELKQRFISKN